jgi:sodium transport system ATP-binding protein
LQAEGTPAGLLERHNQPDLEELFFHLVERARGVAAAAAAQSSWDG